MSATSIQKRDAILTTLKINATTASTSTTTGAAVVAGGLAVAGNVTAGTLSSTVASTGMAGATSSSFVPIIFNAAGEAITDNVAVSNATYYTSITTTGAAAGALANGTMVGQLKLIRMIVDAGDYVLTPVTLLGGTTITFNDALDEVELMWTATGWRILKNVGATVA